MVSARTGPGTVPTLWSAGPASQATMSFLVFWLLASVGSTVILTNGSIFAGLRARLPEGNLRTLASCPMCSGFWFGALWSVALASPALHVIGPSHSLLAQAVGERSAFVLLRVEASFADACASSLASHVLVATWLLVARATNTLNEFELAANLGRYVASLRYPLPQADGTKSPPEEGSTIHPSDSELYRAAHISVVRDEVETYLRDTVVDGSPLRSVTELRYYYLGVTGRESESRVTEDCFLGMDQDYPRQPGYYAVDAVYHNGKSALVRPWFAVLRN